MKVFDRLATFGHLLSRGTELGDNLEYTYLHDTVWVAIFAKNSFDVVELLS